MSSLWNDGGRRFTVYPFSIAVLLLVCVATSASASSDVDFATRLTLGSRTGLFASAYSSNDSITVQDTGLGTVQANASGSLSLSIAVRRTTLRADYYLDLSNNIAEDNDYLMNLFHRLGIALTTRATQTSTVNVSANAGMGILDYSSAQSRFDEVENGSAPNLPQNDNLRFVNVSASAGISKQISRLAGGTVALAYNTSLPIGYQDDENLPFSNQHQATLRLNYNRNLSRQDTFQLGTSGGFVFNVPGPEFVPVQLTTGWAHAMSQDSRWSLNAGLMMAYEFSLDNDILDENLAQSGESLTYWIPQGNLSYQRNFSLKRRKVLSTAITAGFNAYFDRVTASIRQQLRVGLTGGLRFSSKWALNGIGTFSTLFIPTPANASSDTPPPPVEYPTVATMNLGATYRPTRQGSSDVLLQFGISTSARWAHIWEPEFRARAFEEFIFNFAVTGVKEHLN